MKYKASSVKEELKRKNLSYDRNFSNNRKQYISIFHGTPKSLSTLVFYFPVSSANKDGFIDSNDIVLRRLIDDSLIDESMLESV